LDDAQTELENKQTEVTELHGKVVSIRSHALKLEDELRAMNSGKSSNVQRVNELQQEVQIQKKHAGVISLTLCDHGRAMMSDQTVCTYTLRIRIQHLRIHDQLQCSPFADHLSACKTLH
jgi:predicted nuclease with TOPRIM domain